MRCENANGSDKTGQAYWITSWTCKLNLMYRVSVPLFAMKSWTKVVFCFILFFVKLFIGSKILRAPLLVSGFPNQCLWTILLEIVFQEFQEKVLHSCAGSVFWSEGVSSLSFCDKTCSVWEAICAMWLQCYHTETNYILWQNIMFCAWHYRLPFQLEVIWI